MDNAPTRPDTSQQAAWPPPMPAESAPEAGETTTHHDDGGQINARTLINLRWVAIGGQVLTVVAVHSVLKYPLPLAPVIAVIAAAVIANIVALEWRRRQPRLDGTTAAIWLAFDIMQLAVLLFLTGGLENPFSLMILAPVTVSATILSFGTTIALSVATLLVATGLAVMHLPLPWRAEGFGLPSIYVLGLWAAFVIAVLFITSYVWRVADEARRMRDALAATQLALAREQRMSAVGGLAAAAAHELGSPLSTIAVVTTELARAVPPDSPLSEDIELLKSESRRCSDILARLSKAPQSGMAKPFERVPLTAIVDEAIGEPQSDTVEIIVEAHPWSEESGDGAAVTTEQPMVLHRPEMIHGLATLIENATQFARETVEVSVTWTTDGYTVQIDDDGPGFTPLVMQRLGEPYVSSRSGRGGHMGLGIFIAKTLLERTGARLTFENRRDRGASVTVAWRSA